MDWRCGSREGRKRERAEGREGEKEGEKEGGKKGRRERGKEGRKKIIQRKLTGHHTILRPAKKKPPTVPRLVENIACERKGKKFNRKLEE
jgi:hypothetical protein